MASKYATKKPKPIIDSFDIGKTNHFGRDYVRMWNVLRGIAECPTICPSCKEKAEEVLKAKYDEEGKRI